MTQRFANIIKNAKAAVVAALALVLWTSGAASAFFVRAEDKGVGAHESVCRIIYRFDSSVLYPDYLGNAATLEKLDSLATVCASNGVSGLVITSYSSLEGNYAYNTSLSERRANTLKDYVLRQHPLLRGRISTNVQAESWEDLKIALLSDSRFNASEKDQIVSIITSDEDPDVREARLKALPSYKRLYAAYFSRLRYAEIRFVEDAAAAFGGASAAEPAGTPAEPAAAETVAEPVAETVAEPVEAPSAATASPAAGKLTDRNRVLFPLSSTTVDRAYATNNEVLEAISRLLESHNPDDFESIVVTSGSSIDGTTSSNDEISRERGESLVKWIEENYPQYKGCIKLNSRGEDWDVFREAVESDPNISRVNRNSILSIVDSNDTSDNKEARLRSLSSWDYIENNVLPRTRYASLDCTTSDKAAAAADITSTDSTASDRSAAAAAASGKRGGLDPEPGRVYFRKDKTDVDRDYLDNENALAYIDSLLSSVNPDEVESIEIRTSASPDGTVSHNDKVEARRAESVRRYIESKYPEFSDKVKETRGGENWTEFRSLVEADDELSESSKQKILSVIDSSATPDEKEQVLRELDEYEHLAENEFPMLRYSRIEVSKSKDDTKSKGRGGFESQDDKSSEAAAASVSDRNASEASGKRGGLDPEPGRVYFRKDKTDVDRDYLDNENALAYIDSLLSSVNPDEVESIEIRTSASPDGTVSHNDKVEARRAESVRRYIESKYPEFSDKVKETRGGENWTEFRRNVGSDDEMSEPLRKRILSIIDSDDSADRKEQRLRDMDEYDEVAGRHFPALRYAETRITRRQKEEPKAPEAPEIPAEDIETEEVELSVEQDTLDTFVAPVDTLATPVAEPVPEPVEEPLVKPLFAVSTNALYDLAITPNFAIEVPVSKKVTLFGEYTFPWWVTRDNSRAWEILKWDIGARYWLFGGRSSNPMDIMIGPFAGIDLGAGYYDIEPHHKGWQGEFQTVGLEIGWAWDLGRNWRLDAYVGAGWLGSHFRYYQASTDDKHLIYQESGKLTWFGPTKAGVSFKYIFSQKDRRAEK